MIEHINLVKNLRYIHLLTDLMILSVIFSTFFTHSLEQTLDVKQNKRYDSCQLRVTLNYIHYMKR